MAASSGGGGGGREESAKSSTADQISQSIQSTSNILQLMLQSSPSHVQLMKLPKQLLAKTSMIKNTELVLEQMPRVISSLDEHVESGLHRYVSVISVQPLNRCSEHSLTGVPHLRTVEQLLSNMRSNQLKPLSIAQLTQQERQLLQQQSESN